MSDERVREALRALAESDGEREAPAEVEVRLREAFRGQRTRQGHAVMWRRAGVWTAAAAAAIAAVVIFTQEKSRPVLPPVTAVGQSAKPQPVTIAVVPAPVSSKPARQARRIQAEPQPEEVVTDFFPLMDVPPPFQRGSLIRVNVPAAAMRSVGFPVNEDHLSDPIQADILVGEEGLARAIRFVKYEQ